MGGVLQTSKALRLGIHPRSLYAMKAEGMIELMERGLYRLSTAPLPTYPDYTTVALKVPQGVLCLISALSFHAITTQIPHVVDIALKSGGGKNHESSTLHVGLFGFPDPLFQAGLKHTSSMEYPSRFIHLQKQLRIVLSFETKSGSTPLLKPSRWVFLKRNAPWMSWSNSVRSAGWIIL